MGTGAANGSFKLIVDKLATASKVSTKVYANGAGSVVNPGKTPTTLTMTQNGKAYDLSVPAGATLQQVRDSINSQFGVAGLSANVLTDANGSRLIVTSTKMGEGSDITLSGNSGIDTGYTVVEEPADAEYTLDGVAMKSRPTTSMMPSAGSISSWWAHRRSVRRVVKTATILSLTTSSATLKSGLKGFIDTYNALLTVMNAETKVTKNADGTMTAAALTGDATMRTLMTSIREELNAVSGNGTLKSLAAFGNVCPGWRCAKPGRQEVGQGCNQQCGRSDQHFQWQGRPAGAPARSPSRSPRPVPVHLPHAPQVLSESLTKLGRAGHPGRPHGSAAKACRTSTTTWIPWSRSCVSSRTRYSARSTR